MHLLELFVVVNGLIKLIAVFVSDDIQKDKAVVGVILVHIGGQEGCIAFAVIINGVEQLKLKLVALVIYNGNKIVAVIFFHKNDPPCIGSRSF